MRESEREMDRGKETEREIVKEGHSKRDGYTKKVCVCVCVWMCERWLMAWMLSRGGG